MKGNLIRTNDGIWMVKWSDLHSFGQGTEWIYTELSPRSNSIRYVKDGEIKYKTLEEGLEVQFEHDIDTDSFGPFRYAKLIFPEVDKMDSPTQNPVQTDLYWLKNKLWEEGWKGFNNDEQTKTIELLNHLINNENE